MYLEGVKNDVKNNEQNLIQTSRIFHIQCLEYNLTVQYALTSYEEITLFIIICVINIYI